MIVKSSDCKPEGASRPHFFHGVATIVLKLFNIVKPDVAYFGQKDAQQCSTIKQMAADLNVDCDIEICDTVREADGVAMSTRNSYLSQEERKAAPVIYKSLQAAENLVKQGQHDVSALKQVCIHTRHYYKQNMLIDIADKNTPCPVLSSKARVCMIV